jgi:hypothetical protein
MDVVGDMEGELDGDMDGGSMVLGARGRHHRAQRVPTPRWMNATTSQGVSRPQEELDFLPFTPVTFDTNNPATGVLLARPQRPFRGERIIISAFLVGGDPTVGLFVIDPAIYVGAVQVGAAQGSTPIEAFAATAFGVRISMPAAGQGTDIKIFLRAVDPALFVEGTAVVSAVLIGRAMR